MRRRAYYRASIASFLDDSDERILGELAGRHDFSLEIFQRNAWIEQIANLKSQLGSFRAGTIFLEFSIPRLGKRADAVLLSDGLVFVLEYKIGAHSFDRAARDQVLDYALDLKNFHAGSHHRTIVPVLIATEAERRFAPIELSADNVAAPLLSNGSDLSSLLEAVVKLHGRLGEEPEEPDDWAEYGYKPTPTIVEAAQALYRGHAVEEITRSDAGADNLSRTAKAISQIISRSREMGRKSICFVTGVPGAGKTLAGLNISTQKIVGTEEHAVFLSGNGPLVEVLREALARDQVAQSQIRDRAVSKKVALQRVSAFIQNIHHFRDEGLMSNDPPAEHVVVFDEAQRAWNQVHAEKFMRQKRGAASFPMSEPEFLISLMDRRQDWCVVVCLVGGGQEINTGEAGLVEWLSALERRFKHWDVYHSGELDHANYNWSQDLTAKAKGIGATEVRSLHLSVSIRSFRAEKVSEFVGSVITGNAGSANALLLDLDRYPLAITRDIRTTRSWLREHGRGTERIGLVASSGGHRLKPEGIHIGTKIEPAYWFLNHKEDVRSSYYLEDVATEFDVQGLELDWVGVCWDADFRMERNGWRHYAFKGTKWQNVNDAYRQIYLANAYRVLLTRARQGMVIFVPRGNAADPTRPPEYYDGIYEFLRACGVHEIRESDAATSIGSLS